MDDFQQDEILLEPQIDWNGFQAVARALRKNSQLCDVTLHVWDGQQLHNVHAHRLILACVSPYFRDLLVSEEVEVELGVSECGLRATQLLLASIYGETITLHHQQDLHHLYQAAKHFKVDQISSALEPFVKDLMTEAVIHTSTESQMEPVDLGCHVPESINDLFTSALVELPENVFQENLIELNDDCAKDHDRSVEGTVEQSSKETSTYIGLQKLFEKDPGTQVHDADKKEVDDESRLRRSARNNIKTFDDFVVKDRGSIFSDTEKVNTEPDTDDTVKSIKCKRSSLSDMSYMCALCSWHGGSKMEHECHQAEQHAIGKPFHQEQRCNSCQMLFTYKVLYKHHLKMEHGKVIFVCPEDVCDTTMQSRALYDNHLENAHSKEMRCPLCEDRFTSHRDWRKHIRLKHQKKGRYPCQYCDSNFTKIPGLKSHMYKEHDILEKDWVLTCDYINCMFTTLDPEVMKTHRISHSITATHRCQLCSKRFQTVRSLKRHMLYWHKRSGARCKHCHKELRGPARQLRCHERICGQTDKQFTCPHCTFQTNTTDSLKNHIFTKHGVTPTSSEVLVCPICGYQTIKHSVLSQHLLRTHSDEKPYGCHLCRRSFIYAAELKRHIGYTHTETKPYMCSVCAYTAKTERYLKQHVRLKHTHPGIKPYKCAYCHHTSTLYTNCRKHVRREHPSLPVHVQQLFDLNEKNMV